VKHRYLNLSFRHERTTPLADGENDGIRAICETFSHLDSLPISHGERKHSKVLDGDDTAFRALFLGASFRASARLYILLTKPEQEAVRMDHPVRD